MPRSMWQCTWLSPSSCEVVFTSGLNQGSPGCLGSLGSVGMQQCCGVAINTPKTCVWNRGGFAAEGFQGMGGLSQPAWAADVALPEHAQGLMSTLCQMLAQQQQDGQHNEDHCSDEERAKVKTYHEFTPWVERVWGLLGPWGAPPGN